MLRLWKFRGNVKIILNLQKCVRNQKCEELVKKLMKYYNNGNFDKM